MRTLVIHPKDSTTDFLKPIYAPIKDKTVIWGGINKSHLRKHIENHDRIIMLGHGSPWGLLNVGQFPMAGNYIIDFSYSDLLSVKKGNIYIWCHADQFIQRHGLPGFYSGMFISDQIEGFSWGFNDCNPYMIEESNIYFSEIVAKNINKPMKELYHNVLQDYTILAKTNPIAKFNLERLNLNSNNIELWKHSFL